MAACTVVFLAHVVGHLKWIVLCTTRILYQNTQSSVSILNQYNMYTNSFTYNWLRSEYAYCTDLECILDRFSIAYYETEFIVCRAQILIHSIQCPLQSSHSLKMLWVTTAQRRLMTDPAVGVVNILPKNELKQRNIFFKVQI